MSIEEPNVVDGMATSKENDEVVLLISDHLPWENKAIHFSLIEDKIGRYIDFINSGQITDSIPAAAGLPPRICLIHQYDPDPKAIEFLSAARNQLLSMGINFSYEPLPSEY